MISFNTFNLGTSYLMWNLLFTLWWLIWGAQSVCRSLNKFLFLTTGWQIWDPTSVRLPPGPRLLAILQRGARVRRNPWTASRTTTTTTPAEEDVGSVDGRSAEAARRPGQRKQEFAQTSAVTKTPGIAQTAPATQHVAFAGAAVVLIVVFVDVKNWKFETNVGAERPQGDRVHHGGSQRGRFRFRKLFGQLEGEVREADVSQRCTCATLPATTTTAATTTTTTTAAKTTAIEQRGLVAGRADLEVQLFEIFCEPVVNVLLVLEHLDDVVGLPLPDAKLSVSRCCSGTNATKHFCHSSRLAVKFNYYILMGELCTKRIQQLRQINRRGFIWGRLAYVGRCTLISLNTHIRLHNLFQPHT